MYFNIINLDKYSMKAITKLMSVFFISIALFACSNEEKSSEDENLNFKLESPNGNILAKSTEQLKEIIINNSNIININDLTISSVRYNENETGSFAIVDFLNKDSNSSMFVPLLVNENYSLFIDNDNIYLNKLDKKSSIENIDESKILNIKSQTLNADLSSRVSYVCNGSCCGWSQPGPDHYNCGCPDASLILTTSDGCQIQVL
jgi:hypothetical protein